MSGRATGGRWDGRASRRDFLATMGSLLAALGVAGGTSGCAEEEGHGGLELLRNPAPPAPSLPQDPFQLSVASGDPLSDRVVIWTRLAPDPLSDGGMPQEDVPVIWEVFSDEEGLQPVRNGWAWARPALAHSVHVDVDGLRPDTFYWYRFRVGDAWQSPMGRTRTWPAPADSPDELRLAFACCQKYRSGFYSAHAHLAEMDLHGVVFLGDYIYESGNDPEVEGRLPIDLERVTDLPGFRGRYGGYRMDPDLQASHAMHPWIVTWDDHEVSNNYAGMQLSESRSRDGDGEEIRRAGYQAWYEHMPVRIPMPEDPAFMKIYRSFAFGDLVSMQVLDARQYRDPQPCEDEIGPPCEELLAGGLSMLGPEQKAWLLEELQGSQAHWNVIAQQVLFTPVLMEVGFANPDQWDGYLDSRQQILDVLADPAVQRPMVISGDVHAAGFAELYADQMDAESPTVAYEVLATSISSGGDGAEGIARAASLAEVVSDRAHYFDAARRGFAVCTWRREACEVVHWAVTTVSAREADRYRAAVYRIDAGDFSMQEVERNRRPPQ